MNAADWGVRAFEVLQRDDSAGSALLTPGLLTRARAQGVVEMVGRAVDGYRIDVSTEADDLLATHRRRLARQAVMLESRAIHATELLRTDGVPSRVLKGLALARLDYPDPAIRPTSDIDLLIPADAMTHAIDLLSSIGFRRRYPEPFLGADTAFSKGAALVGADRVEVDLHRTLALGYFGSRIHLSDLWSSGEKYDLAGRELDALGRADRLLHAAIHLSLDPNPRLINVADVALLTCRVGGDFVTSAERACHWGCGALLADSLRVATSSFGVPETGSPPARWASNYRSSVSERTWLMTYRGKFAGSRARTLGQIFGLRTRQERVSAVVGLARGRRRRG